MSKKVFVPADNIADGDMKYYYSIQNLRKIRREHLDTAQLLLCRGERRIRAKGEIH